MKLEFARDFPTSAKNIVREPLQKYVNLFPLWMQCVIVQFDEGDSENRATLRVQPDYRRCILKICPFWLSQIASVRDEDILHEILHCYNAPISDVAAEILDLMVPYGTESEDTAVKQLYDTLSSKIRAAVERTNCDLVYAVDRYGRGLAAKSLGHAN